MSGSIELLFDASRKHPKPYMEVVPCQGPCFEVGGGGRGLGRGLSTRNPGAGEALKLSRQV